MWRFEYGFPRGLSTTIRNGHGEAVFTNRTFMLIEEIEKQIRACLKDGEFFIAWQIKIEERFFFDVL